MMIMSGVAELSIVLRFWQPKTLNIFESNNSVYSWLLGIFLGTVNSEIARLITKKNFRMLSQKGKKK